MGFSSCVKLPQMLLQYCFVAILMPIVPMPSKGLPRGKNHVANGALVGIGDLLRSHLVIYALLHSLKYIAHAHYNK